MKRKVFKAIFAIGLFVMLLFGCGGGGDDSPPSNPNNPSDPNNKPQTVNSSLDNAIKFASRSLTDESRKKKFMSTSSTIPTPGLRAPELSAGSADDGYGYEENGFECGSFSQLNETSFTFSFDGSCDGIYGTMTMTVNQDQSMRFEYGNLQIPVPGISDCVVNGVVLISFNVDQSSGTYTYTYEFQDLSFCGQLFSGTYSYSIDEYGNITYDFGDNTYAYEGQVEVDTDLECNEQDLFNGKVQVNFNDGIFAMTAENVRVDESCGYPAAGSLIIEDENQAQAVVDFSNTTCDNPVATCTVDGEAFDVNLAD